MAQGRGRGLARSPVVGFGAVMAVTLALVIPGHRPLGFSREALRAQEAESPGIWLAGAGLGTLAVGGALLTLGLIQRWGEVYPRWIVFLRDKPVRPRTAALTRYLRQVGAPPWRGSDDPVRSNRHADAAAAAGYQGDPGARHGARIAVGGRTGLLGRGQSRGPVGREPHIAWRRAGHSAGSGPGLAPAGPALDPERSSATDTALHAGRRIHGCVRGRRGTASVGLGCRPVAGPAHPP